MPIYALFQTFSNAHAREQNTKRANAPALYHWIHNPYFFLCSDAVLSQTFSKPHITVRHKKQPVCKPAVSDCSVMLYRTFITFNTCDLPFGKPVSDMK